MVEKSKQRSIWSTSNEMGRQGSAGSESKGLSQQQRASLNLQTVSKEKNGISSHVFSASLNNVSFQALPVKAWPQNCHQRIINIFKTEGLERSSISFLITVLVSRQYLGTWASASDPTPKDFTSLYA